MGLGGIALQTKRVILTPPDTSRVFFYTECRTELDGKIKSLWIIENYFTADVSNLKESLACRIPSWYELETIRSLQRLPS